MVLLGPSLSRANLARIRSTYMRCKVDEVDMVRNRLRRTQRNCGMAVPYTPFVLIDRNNFVVDWSQIYQPMWCPGHWYLMILDRKEKKMIYLDSNPIRTESDQRINWMIRTVCEHVTCRNVNVNARSTKQTHVTWLTFVVSWQALYIEFITLDRDWLSSENATRPHFGSFQPEVAVVPQQNDCGVWVAKWMVREAFWRNFGVVAVNRHTHMEMAIDLVMNEHNKIAHNVTVEALAYWHSSALDSPGEMRIRAMNPVMRRSSQESQLQQQRNYVRFIQQQLDTY
ncbi:hypothetical protein PIB30_028057 [Stylosanthes scabra]|uniref:Ubiquitin-like protease family profile domain-containing protein n=1 Tax=Stylosanthes scabra TaxID=79078 RepID=A0ABU6RBM7_9FABA|nr:hypothetical protein [Stylosanthes scabra]